MAAEEVKEAVVKYQAVLLLMNLQSGLAKRWKFYAITPKTIKLGSHLQGMK